MLRFTATEDGETLSVDSLPFHVDWRPIIVKIDEEHMRPGMRDINVTAALYDVVNDAPATDEATSYNWECDIKTTTLGLTLTNNVTNVTIGKDIQ